MTIAQELYNYCVTIVQGLRDMGCASCDSFHHMGPMLDPSHINF
jgi:hypothetical protein